MEHKDDLNDTKKEQPHTKDEQALEVENTDAIEDLDEKEADETAEELEHEEGEDEAGGGKKRKRGSRGGSGNGQKSKELEEELTKVNAELSDMKDKYLRLYAEFDNYRKRTSKEKLDLIKTASQDVIVALLPILDDFERAKKASEASGETFSEGVMLIYDKLFRTAEQQGLKPMESTGQPFDSDSHEAITKIPAPVADLKGKVVDTVEKGYYLHDKIIRYAKVVVGE